MGTTEQDESSEEEVDIRRNRFPYSIVWGPLCPLTCCCPVVGHMGIADSQGKIHDFAGPYCINVDRFMVGSVWRYAVVSSPEDAGWDDAVARADKEYRRHNHSICCDNCHHHTALALTESGRRHTLLSAWLACCIHGKFTCCR